MHDMGKTIPELYAMLKLEEKSIPKKALDVLAIRQGKIQKPKSQAREKGKQRGKGRSKLAYDPRHKIPLPAKKENLAKDTDWLRGYRKLNKGALDQYVGNGHSVAVEAIGSFELILPSGMILILDNCHFPPSITRELQHDGLLKSIDDESFDVCVSCIFGKMARKPFTHASERADDLLGIIHSDVYGPFRTTSREGYPKETMGYYFYYPLENKFFVAQYAEFFETNLIKQQASGSIVDFDEIQREDAQPSENTSQHQHEVEHDTLRDNREPPNYRATLSDPESEKWLEAMNAKMQSMKDNQVWNLVDLPPNCKTVGIKWLFKKKTDMDGNIHTYKVRLVAKGFTQTYRVDYKETFSHVADIKAIRILIANVLF
ncbi:retrotransposon protein, putative, ty1-copia subclass [Tanacetum coccineum]|uniref:Retrotransposon protein, putative, ty1-copia subclass n=1 Tax=Tanacetum coccineum TaxID=301880 RepID=A0ABQ5FHS1_9ASTR